jgi:chromatin segregation and condensation protein Rec8/ScpA/Scc1 (kleisin family)
MDWKARMMLDEAELKTIVDRLGQVQGQGMRAKIEREYAMRSLSRKLAEMRTFVDDCLCGRTAYEQSVLEYRMRVEYPLYSHLDSLSAMPREFVDWSCA